MFTFANGVRGSGLKDVLLNNYQLSNATRWNDDERKHFSHMYHSISAKKSNFSDDHDDDLLQGNDNTQKAYSSKTIIDAKLESSFCQNQYNSMTDIFKDVSVQSTNTDGDPSIDTTLPDHGLKDFSSDCPVHYVQDVHGLHETVGSIKAAQLENITSPISGSDPFTEDTNQYQPSDLTEDEPQQKKPAIRHLWGNL
jgi:hypothetical protein